MFMTLEPESKLNKRIGAKTLTWFKFKLIFLVGDSEHTKVNQILEANEGDIAIFKLILHFAGDMQLVSTSVFSRLYIFHFFSLGTPATIFAWIIEKTSEILITITSKNQVVFHWLFWDVKTS